MLNFFRTMATQRATSGTPRSSTASPKDAINSQERGREAMSVITPSFAPDFELCADLHRSVLEYSPNSVHHHIVVPRSDLKLFGRLAGPRTHIR